MSYALSYASSRPSSARRSGLLGIVIGLHVAILLVVLAAKTIVPQIMEIPLVVDLLQAPEVQKPPEAKPLPMAKPQPVKQPRLPTPKAPTPLIEATTSTAPAPSAPVAVPQESQPAPPAPPAEAPIKQTRRCPSAWVKRAKLFCAFWSIRKARPTTLKSKRRRAARASTNQPRKPFVPGNSFRQNAATSRCKAGFWSPLFSNWSNKNAGNSTRKRLRLCPSVGQR